MGIVEIYTSVQNICQADLDANFVNVVSKWPTVPFQSFQAVPVSEMILHDSVLILGENYSLSTNILIHSSSIFLWNWKTNLLYFNF